MYVCMYVCMYIIIIIIIIIILLKAKFNGSQTDSLSMRKQKKQKQK